MLKLLQVASTDSAEHRPVRVLEAGERGARRGRPSRSRRGRTGCRPGGSYASVLKKVLSTLNERVRPGVTGASSLVAVRRSFAVGCTSRANGRIWVADDRRGIAQERALAAQGRGELAGERAQALERGAELRGERVDVAEGGGRLRERRGEQLEGLAEVGLLCGERLEVRVGRVHEVGQLLVLAPSAVDSSWKLWITRLMFRRRLVRPLRELPAVARGGLEALERLAEVLRGGLLVSAAVRRP